MSSFTVSFFPMKIKLFLYLSGIIFSILGWIGYARFVYITTIDPDLTIEGYDKKYFSTFPKLLNGIDKANAATAIILVLAVVLIIFSGFLFKRYRVFAYIFLILDSMIIAMLAFAYM